jgi:hypothetical protein
VVTVVLVGVLLGLLAWQRVRQQEIARCLDDGGSWTGGIRASCVPGRPVILRRDLHRT